MAESHIDHYLVGEVMLGDKQSIEQMGTKPKFWTMDPKTGKLWLFKYGRKNTGEDWSEKIAAEVAELLAIPHAVTELAKCDGRPGTVSLDFTEQGSRGSLVHGNELLIVVISDYPQEQTFHASQHTLANIVCAIRLADNSLPPEYPVGIREPIDLFLGYLMLDALIGNTDRHHENWGLLVKSAPYHAELAPTFDHASSLGRELQDQKRESFMAGQGNGIAGYAKKARSAIYASSDDRHPLTTLEAVLLLAKQRPDAYATWQQRLAMLSDERFHEVVYRVPEEFMSSASKDFAFRLLMCNKTRILETSLG